MLTPSQDNPTSKLGTQKNSHRKYEMLKSNHTIESWKELKTKKDTEDRLRG